MDDVRNLIERLEELVRNVHQYVGARYVPNFIDEPWSDVRGYEALDVVDNGTGTSYIAKKPVPVGTPLNNREYWFVYGSTSGAIINLQNQIDDINDEIDVLNTYAGTDRIVLCIGDSYLGGADRDYAETNSWGALLRILLGNGNNTKIAGVGSTGFIGGLPDYTFMKQLQSLENNLTADEKLKVSDIIVQGGLNDQGYSGSQLQSAITTFCQYVGEHFPNAVLRIGVVGWTTYAVNLDKYFDTLNNYSNPFNPVCKVQFMEGLQYIMPSLDTTSFTDGGIHPNGDASYAIARAVYNCMLGGGGNLARSVGKAVVPITFNSGVTARSSSLKYNLSGGNITLYDGYFWLDFDPALTFGFDNAVDLAAIEYNCPIRSANINNDIACSIWATDSNDSQYLYSGFVRIYNNKIALIINGGVDVRTYKTIFVRMSSYTTSVHSLC